MTFCLLKTLYARALAVVTIALACLAPGCDARRDESGRIDVPWHTRNLTEGVLPRWLELAPAESGFTRTAFDRTWKPKAQQPGTLTEHARLVYALIMGYEFTRDKRYLAAADSAADFLLTRFRDPVHGGFFNRVGPDGKVISDIKNTYGHAFALLALSNMARVTGQARWRTAALAAWRDIDLWLRDGKGGFFKDFAARLLKNRRCCNRLKNTKPVDAPV